MDIKIEGFEKDDATQELLGYAGIVEPYENVISRVSLDILRQSAPDCEIEKIVYVEPAGSHPDMRVGGIPIEEGSSKIKLQDMTMPFDLIIIVRSGDIRHELETTFTFECKNIDEQPETEYNLVVHGQKDA